MFRNLILGLLRSAGPLHGYALMKECFRRSGLRFSTGNFYRELARLSADGLVRQVGNPAGADARRAPYEITDAGERCFQTWLRGQNALQAGRYDDDLSARVLFLGDTDPSARDRLIEHWRDDLWIERKRLERARQSATSAVEEEGAALAALTLLIDRRLEHLAADVGFIDSLRVLIESQPRADAPPPATTRRPGPPAAAVRAPAREVKSALSAGGAQRSARASGVRGQRTLR